MLHTVETSTEYLTTVCGMFPHKCPGYSFANHVFFLDTFASQSDIPSIQVPKMSFSSLAFLYFEFKTLNQNDLPIRLADLPVGPNSKTLGFRGSSPALLRIFSAHFEIVLIRNVLPTPPPPVTMIFRIRTGYNAMITQIQLTFKKNAYVEVMN